MSKKLAKITQRAAKGLNRGGPPCGCIDFSTYLDSHFLLGFTMNCKFHFTIASYSYSPINVIRSHSLDHGAKK